MPGRTRRRRATAYPQGGQMDDGSAVSGLGAYPGGGFGAQDVLSEGAKPGSAASGGPGIIINNINTAIANAAASGGNMSGTMQGGTGNAGGGGCMMPMCQGGGGGGGGCMMPMCK